MGRLKIYDQVSGQFLEITTFPQKGTLSFTTPTVAGVGGIDTHTEPGFNNRSLVRKLKVTPTDPSVNAFQIDFYRDSTFSEDKLEYRATASGTFIDNDVWFHEDEENAGEVHVRITNSAVNASTFQIELTAEVFA